MFEVYSLRKGMPFVIRVILSFFNRMELIRQRLRYFVLKSAFKSCGENVIIRRNVIFVYPEYIEIGDNVSLNSGCYIEGGGRVSIGNDVRIAPFVSVISSNHSFVRKDIPIREQGYDRAQVVIEDDVWLGTKVTVLPGVRVGKGSVIGSNSVVTHDVPPYSVAAGVPAKVIKKR